MLAAYMQSLYEAFQNETLGRQIQNIDFSNINFTALPVYATGYIYHTNATIKTDNCSSIWLQPLSGNLTLIAGQNNTMGQSVQAIYKLNGTDPIIYKMLTANDIVYIDQLYTRNKAGTVTEMTNVTITIENLDRYSYLYITGYTPMDFTTTNNWLTGVMIGALITIVLITTLIGTLTKRKR